MNRLLKRIPWRDILTFPLSGLSLRLFFLILGLMLILIWQLVWHASEQLAAYHQQHLAHLAAQLQQQIPNHLPANIALQITSADGQILYQHGTLREPTYTLAITLDNQTPAELTVSDSHNPTATLRRLAFVISAIAFILLAALAYWLARALRRISQYADAMAQGKPAQSPEFSDIYLKRLAESVTTLRRELNGKTLVEHYVQNLTHELKTPLTAIHAAAEILHEPLSDAERAQFLAQIERHSAQMHSLINRLLELARLENRDSLTQRERIALAPLIEALCAEYTQPIELSLEPTTIHSAPLLIRQAIQNLLDNAIAFAHPDTPITIQLADHTLTITNHGDPIPDYALPRLFERFFSLPRPTSGQKSSGLGLAFVKHIMDLHGGSVTLVNTRNGVQATLQFTPQNSKI